MDRPWLKHIPKGNPIEVDIPERSLPQLFEEAAKKYSTNIAITFFGQTYTYAELRELIHRAAHSFANMGVQKGDRIAIMLPNCPQYPISYYAALLCGATIVQVNPMYQANELLYVLNDSGAKVIIALEQHIPIIEKVQEESDLEKVITASFESGSNFDELLKDRPTDIPNVSIDPKEDIAVLQYTGGTTGRSKGAMLTHYNVVANTIQSSGTSRIRTRLGEERVLAISPLFHVYGMTSCMSYTFYIGGNLILVPKFDVKQTVEVIEKMKPTIFPGVPTVYIALLNYYKEHPFNLSCLKTCTSGSAPLPLEVLEQFNKTSGTTVSEGYGLSEASPVTHRNPITGLQKAGSIGIPIPNTDSKIVDPETREGLPIGEVGELAVKGPQIMKGYWNMREETEEVLQDGWLYTGDLAKMDEDGFFYLVGRKKELIIASGYNVYPIDIEDVLYTHPSVLEAAVIGVPDSYRGETIKACIVLKEGETVQEEELISYCRDRLAAYKVPRSIQLLDEMPKTAVGKILKRKLVEQYR